MAVNDTMFVIGGTCREDSHVYGDAMRYVFEDNEWLESGFEALSEPRWGHGCVLVGERIYCIGGSSGYEALATVESMSVHGGAWRAEPQLLHTRHLSAVVAEGTRIYAIGGHTGPGEAPEVKEGHAALSTVEVWDTAGEGGWREAPPLRTAVYQAAAAVDQGRVYALGGLDRGGNPSYYAFSLKEGAKYWSEEACMVRARFGATAQVVQRPLYLRAITPPPDESGEEEKGQEDDEVSEGAGNTFFVPPDDFGR